MAKWSFINSLDGFTTIPFGTTTLPGPVGGGSLTVLSSLYVNGISKVPFADISGWTVMRNPQSFAGDGNADVLWMGSGSDNTAIVWDERTTEQGVGGPFFDMYEGYIGDAAGNNIRYGLPGGGIGQETISIETIRGGDAHDFVNLSYDGGTYNYMIGGVSTPVAGRAYMLDITIDVGAGRDLVIAGEGNDVIYGGDENLNLGDGLMGMGGNDTIYGGRNFSSSGSDDLYGYAGNDTIYGANSGEVYYGDSGNDVIYGGGAFNFDPGTPSIGVGATTDNTFYGGDGDDMMYAAATFTQSREFFYGGNPGQDWVDRNFVENANGLDNSLNDTVNYSLWTGAAVSIDLQTASGFGTGAGAAANDRFYGIEHLVGSNSVTFGDTLIGSSAGNRLQGMAGNDTLDGEGGNDTLDGGAGNDTLVSGFGSDSMIGGAGTDTLTYASATGAVTISMSGGIGVGDHGSGDTIAGDIEVLVGSGFDDALTGSAIANTILGGNGNDTIDGGDAGDSLDGGAGANFLSYASSTGAVNVNLGAPSANGGFAAGDTFVNFQHLIGSENDDFLAGSGVANSLIGGAGNDTLQGLAGSDTLYGGRGDDVLQFSDDLNFTADGNDFVRLWTGEGTNPTATVAVTAGPVSATSDLFRGDNGIDTLTANNGANIVLQNGGDLTVDGVDQADSGGHLQGVEVFVLGGGSDIIQLNDSERQEAWTEAATIFGGVLSDIVVSGSGDDIIAGGNEASGAAADVADIDTLYGGIGNDTIYGDRQGDTATGLGAADTIYGGTGADSLFGNAGADLIYGGSSIDRLFGGEGNDFLAGDASLDTLFGDGGDDLLQLNMDGAVGLGGIVVQGWDGEAGSGPIDVAVSMGARLYGDSAFGGAGTDTLDLALVSNMGGRTVYTASNWNTLSPTILAGVEIIVAGAAADVINLTFNDGATRNAYGENVTVEAGAGSDIVFSGSGNDLLVGGRRNNVDTPGEGSDTLYGGQGNDIIHGDDLDFDPNFVFGGNDTLYGGQGADTVDGGFANDSIFGGTGLDLLVGGMGDDLIVDNDGADINGKEGSDTIVLNVTTGGSFKVDGGLDDDADGDDFVFVSGNYTGIDSSLGEYNDRYIASSTDSGSAQIDRVFGEQGNDLISTWYGNDIIDGGSQSDGLWGGAGSDTIYGGPDTDYLYGGWGDNDVLVGGAGTDYYYYSRTDGQGDQIFDDFRGTDPLPGQQADNVLVVFPDFDPTEVNGDGLRTGSGVFETDHDLYDLAGGDDMVRLTDIDGAAGSMYRLTILTGDGATSYVEFDQRDVQTILLWNNDAAPGTQVIQSYTWDPVDGRYEFVG